MPGELGVRVRIIHRVPWLASDGLESPTVHVVDLEQAVVAAAGRDGSGVQAGLAAGHLDRLLRVLGEPGGDDLLNWP